MGKVSIRLDLTDDAAERFLSLKTKRTNGVSLPHKRVMDMLLFIKA
ncbi:MAG: hypothetical protein OEY81_03575 [Candidatus Bathyarchaeota archaeon]|nr:hypothetical protein [Candidatus Bathyarchaeota archaeon]